MSDGDFRPERRARFRLGDHWVTPIANEIGGVRIDAKAMAVLLALVDAAPEVVPHAVMLERVWPDVVVVDNVVHQAISQLRRALRDDARAPRYIENVPRRGYRLSSSACLEMPTGTPDEERTIWGLKNRNVRTAIAVLPFTSLSGDPNQEFFSEGISEDILDGLARNPHVIVRARHSSFLFKGSREDLRTISEQLDVTHLLTGSVRVAGNQIRVSARLTSVPDDVDVWSERYDRELGDMFALQDDITRAVLEALDVLFAAPKRTEVHPAAYRAFLLGRAHNARFEIVDAARRFTEAAELDDRFAEPLAALAELSQFRDAINMYFPDIRIEHQRTYIERALARDPGQLIARSLRALSLDNQSAIDTLHRLAVEAPANGGVVFAYSLVMRRIGRMDLALQLLSHVVALDPLAPHLYAVRGETYSAAGLFDAAEEDFLTAERLGVPVPNFRLWAAWMRGDVAAAQREIDRPAADWAWLGQIYARIFRVVVPFMRRDDQAVAAELARIEEEFDYLPELAKSLIANLRHDHDKAAEHQRNALHANEPEAWRYVRRRKFERFPEYVESTAYQALLREFGLDEASLATLKVPPLPI